MVKQIKKDLMMLFRKGILKLHKWSVNMTEQVSSSNKPHQQLSYTKHILNQDINESKALDRNW